MIFIARFKSTSSGFAPFKVSKERISLIRFIDIIPGPFVYSFVAALFNAGSLHAFIASTKEPPFAKTESAEPEVFANDSFKDFSKSLATLLALCSAYIAFPKYKHIIAEAAIPKAAAGLRFIFFLRGT